MIIENEAMTKNLLEKTDDKRKQSMKDHVEEDVSKYRFANYML